MFRGSLLFVVVCGFLEMLGLRSGLTMGGLLLGHTSSVGLLRSFATKPGYTTLPPPKRKVKAAPPVKRSKNVGEIPNEGVKSEVAKKKSGKTSDVEEKSQVLGAVKSKKYMQEYYTKNRDKLLEKNQANRKVCDVCCP
jgi:hypothetical protein